MNTHRKRSKFRLIIIVSSIFCCLAENDYNFTVFRNNFQGDSSIMNFVPNLNAANGSYDVGNPSSKYAFNSSDNKNFAEKVVKN